MRHCVVMGYYKWYEAQGLMGFDFGTIEKMEAGEAGEMVVTGIFSFSHNVFKSLFFPRVIITDCTPKG